MYFRGITNFLITVFLLIGCSEVDRKVNSSSFTVSFKEVGIINEAENIEESYFEKIEMVKIGNDNKIYVLDSKKGAVLKFNKDGTYIKKIGRGGRGPGELERPLTMLVDSELVIISEGTNRVDVFTLEGDHKASYNTTKLSPYNKLVRYGKEFWSFNVAFSSDLDTAKILHRYDEKFNPLGESEININHFFNEYTREKSEYHFRAIYSILLTDSVTLIAAIPNIYTGRLTEFKKRNGNWVFNRRVAGKEIQEPYELVKSQAEADFMTLVFNKEFKYDLRSKSKGLFKLNNKKYVHFLELDVGDSLEYGIELFNEDLVYQGYARFYKGSRNFREESFFENGGIYLEYIHEKDSDDQFYVIGFDENGVKVSLRKLEITFSN